MSTSDDSKFILIIDGKEAVVGQTVIDFRGEKAILKGWTAPRHSGSTGRVCVQEENDRFQSEYYPSVYNGEFILK